jgi:hypothetical protein
MKRCACFFQKKVYNLGLPRSFGLWYFHFMERNLLREIFFDHNQHWEAFKRKHGDRIRPIVIKEVEKFRDSGDFKNGFKLFVCEGCNDVRKSPIAVKVVFVLLVLLEQTAYRRCPPGESPPCDFYD